MSNILSVYFECVHMCDMTVQESNIGLQVEHPQSGYTCQSTGNVCQSGG